MRTTLKSDDLETLTELLNAFQWNYCGGGTPGSALRPGGVARQLLWASTASNGRLLFPLQARLMASLSGRVYEHGKMNETLNTRQVRSASIYHMDPLPKEEGYITPLRGPSGCLTQEQGTVNCGGPASWCGEWKLIPVFTRAWTGLFK